METQSSQYHSTRPSSTLPHLPQNHVESFIGSFITLISNCGLRYEGVLYHVNIQDATLGLQTVVCYGTEGRNNIGFQILPSNSIYNYIIFTMTEIKDFILVRPPTRFAYGSVAKEATSSKLLPYNPHDAKIVPSISNEKLNKPQAIGDKVLVKGSVNDRSPYVALNPFPQPGYKGSSFYDPWSNQLYQSTTPFGLPYQEAPVINETYQEAPVINATYQEAPVINATYQEAPVINATYQEAPVINAASEFAARRSYYTTFPPVPISLRPINSGGFVSEAVNQNFKQSEMWPQDNNNNQSYKKTAPTAYSVDESYYMVSRNPFDPIGRPCNPYGSIARPVKHHTKETSNGLQGMHELQRVGYMHNMPFPGLAFFLVNI